MGGILDDPRKPIAYGQSEHWRCEQIEKELRLDLEKREKEVHELKVRLAALEWKPITPHTVLRGNEDEVGGYLEGLDGRKKWTQIIVLDRVDIGTYIVCGWTHFRPINAPTPTPAAPSQTAQTTPDTSAGSQAGVAGTRPPASSTE